MEYGYADKSANLQRFQNVQMLALSALGFLIPFTVGHPQLIVGVLVNAFIIRAAMSLPREKALPVVFTPTLGVLARGLLFGPFTAYVIFMLPFIWVGNYILLWAFSQRTHYTVTLIMSSAAKAGFLYGAAYLLFSQGIVPEIFLTSMGIFQYATALAGGILAYGELEAEKRLFR
ncbi:MAG: hypothetical protein V1875_02830 [Candidatus Altiarchaeota archaeon]